MLVLPFSLALYLSLSLVGCLNLYAFVLTCTSWWRTIFIISFGFFSALVLLSSFSSSSSLNSFSLENATNDPISLVCQCMCMLHSGVSEWTVHGIRSFQYCTLYVFFCRQKRPNMKLNHSKMHITTGNLAGTFFILIILNYLTVFFLSVRMAQAAVMWQVQSFQKHQSTHMILCFFFFISIGKTFNTKQNIPTLGRQNLNIFLVFSFDTFFLL